MSARTAASDAGTRPRGLFRRLFRIVFRVVVVLILIPLVLIPAYLLLSPVSALMAWSFVTGDGASRTWVSLDEMAPTLPAAVVMAEDGRFCEHAGVDWDEIDKVLSRRSGPNRGASTVTMQTVKNLFLWNERFTYLRKGLEIPLALYADLVWSKRRTMEIYLNIVELGPGLFGVEAAAQAYFGKAAKDLTRREAALLVAALPNPIERNPGKPSRFLSARAGTIAARAGRAGAYIDCLKP